MERHRDDPINFEQHKAAPGVVPDWPPDFSLEDAEAISDIEREAEQQAFLKRAFVFLKIVLYHYPLVFWGTIWVLVLLAAGLAVNGLMSPSLSKREVVPGVPPIPGVRQIEATESSSAFPVWSLGAIAFACAGGTFLLSSQLNQAKQRETLPEPLTFEEVVALTAQAGAIAALPAQRSDLLPLAMAQESPILPPLSTQASELQSSEPSIKSLPSASIPEMTPLPPWERSPVQQQAPGLAEVLEIQRRRSQRQDTE